MIRLLLIVLCTFTLTVAATESESIRPIPIEPTSWDFGSVGIDFTIFHSFPLPNTTKKSVRILGVENDCDCTVVRTKDSLLAPGDTAWLEVEFLTRDFFGPTSKSFFVKTDLPDRERIEVVYSALIGQWMWGVKPTPVGVFLLQGQTTKRVQITNITNDKTTLEAIHVHDTIFTVNMVNAGANKGESITFDINARPGLKNGTYLSNATVQIHASGSDKPVLITVPVKIVRF